MLDLPPTLDEVGLAQLKYDQRFYKWNAAIMTMQASGRIRRGEVDHYGSDAEKLVAVVDGNVWSLRGYYSNHFNECLVRI
jgi:hypothetical protein